MYMYIHINIRSQPPARSSAVAASARSFVARSPSCRRVRSSDERIYMNVICVNTHMYIFIYT